MDDTQHFPLPRRLSITSLADGMESDDMLRPRTVRFFAISNGASYDSIAKSLLRNVDKCFLRQNITTYGNITNNDSPSIDIELMLSDNTTIL
jgi:hypothetical protein